MASSRTRPDGADRRSPSWNSQVESSWNSATAHNGLDVVGICKTFSTSEGEVLALDDVSLHVSAGEFATLIGPTGCGKSTLLRIVAGLIQADRGTVSILGDPPSRATAAKRVGFVPQSPALLPWRTVLGNVRLPFQVNRKAREVRARSYRDPKAVLESFGLGGVLNRRPAQLSGGMQQKVAIARAMVFNPSVLLMDEPFSALDELTRERQRHELLELWQSDRKTVLFVTHSVTEAVLLSDVVVVMSGEPGRVASVVRVDLPRPREDQVETTQAFHDTEQFVRTELRRAWRDKAL